MTNDVLRRRRSISRSHQGTLRRRLSALALLLTLTPVACGTGAKSDNGSAQIAMYTGNDREQMLVDGAKQEKDLLWYTTMVPDQLAQPLADAFKKKYPFANVELYRGNSTDVAQKALQEYQARRYTVDLVDGTGTSSLLKQAGVLQPFTSPELTGYTKDLKDADSNWGSELQYFMVLAYNTNLVKPADVPKTYDDLLAPRWKGNMAWSTSPTSGGPLFIGNLLSGWGEDKAMPYLQKLSQQDIRNTNSSGRAVLDQVAAGQVPIALEVFNDQVEASKAKGAPVDWVPLEPVTAQLSRISLTKAPPHPHMAMLFLDFMFSDEGQRIIQSGGGIPARSGVDARVAKLKPDQGGFKALYMDPDDAFDQTKKWSDLYDQLFINR
jgi:ABC-type Fe3+ transport system substrate-binding protein